MSEHYTKGRQGQGARRRKNRHQGRGRYQRMPRPEATPAKKPSLLQRVLGFFGLGKKEELKKKPQHNKQEKAEKTPRQPRQARSNQNAGNGERRRMKSTPPTRNARLYVGNLSYEVTESELEDLFKGFGDVKSVEIIYNPRTYRSKGYAFVEMRHNNDARQAAEVLHGQPFMGRELMVSAASERQGGEAEESPKVKQQEQDQEHWESVPMGARDSSEKSS